MYGYSSAYLFGTVLVFGLLAGCAEQTASTLPQEAKSTENTASSEPQFAGAWYQVQFQSNVSDFDARGRMIIDTVANVVASNPGSRVTVIGKSDRVGSQSANLALSKRRAEEVRNALITAGVPAQRIDTRWTGEAEQEVATGDSVAELRNRVVDVTVVKEMP